MGNLDIQPDQLRKFCDRHDIRTMSLFGSALRDDFGPDSDIDVLVEFEEGHTPGFAFISIQDELSRLLGRGVDLNTPECLSQYFRGQVMAEAELVYDPRGRGPREA